MFWKQPSLRVASLAFLSDQMMSQEKRIVYSEQNESYGAHQERKRPPGSGRQPVRGSELWVCLLVLCASVK